jgi:hypothetical protein
LAAAIYRFSRKFILPAVTLMMILGAISGIIPVTISDSDNLYFVRRYFSGYRSGRSRCYFQTIPNLDRLNVIIEGKLPILLHEYLKKTKLASL